MAASAGQNRLLQQSVAQAVGHQHGEPGGDFAVQQSIPLAVRPVRSPSRGSSCAALAVSVSMAASAGQNRLLQQSVAQAVGPDHGEPGGAFVVQQPLPQGLWQPEQSAN